METQDMSESCGKDICNTSCNQSNQCDTNKNLNLNSSTDVNTEISEEDMNENSTLPNSTNNVPNTTEVDSDSQCNLKLKDLENKTSSNSEFMNHNENSSLFLAVVGVNEDNCNVASGLTADEITPNTHGKGVGTGGKCTLVTGNQSPFPINSDSGREPTNELQAGFSSHQPVDISNPLDNLPNESNGNVGMVQNDFQPKKVIARKDNSVVISNNNALLGAETPVSGKNSLSQLVDYGSEEDDDGSSVVILNYREDKNEDSDSDSSSSSSSTSKIISELSESESDQDELENCDAVPTKIKPIKAKGEYSLDDLPPIEELRISVPEEDCVAIGKVYQIVDQLVVIQSMKGVPAYDLDTVLFFKKGEPLGKIFDVLGPVSEPFYCVRFNSKEQIKEKGISLNDLVYSAPKTEFTNYVFLAQLLKLKGSDASWKNDVEPPESCIDYSDDEQERLARRQSIRSGKAPVTVDLDADEPARKKHFAYEKRMNARNLQLTASRNQRTFVKNRQPPHGFRTCNPWARSPSDHIRTPNLREHRFGGPPNFNNRPPFSPYQSPWGPDVQSPVLRSPQPMVLGGPQPWSPLFLNRPGPPQPTPSSSSYPNPPSWGLLQPSTFNNTRQNPDFGSKNNQVAAPFLPPRPFWLQPSSLDSNRALQMNFNPSVPPPRTPPNILSPPPDLIRSPNPDPRFSFHSPYQQLLVREHVGIPQRINFNPAIPPPPPRNLKKY